MAQGDRQWGEAWRGGWPRAIHQFRAFPMLMPWSWSFTEVVRGSEVTGCPTYHTPLTCGYQERRESSK